MKSAGRCMGYFNRKKQISGLDIQEKSRMAADGRCKCEGRGSFPADFSDSDDEMQTEKDFRMLQGMYPFAAKELLPLIEEECDRMEYEGSAMFDEYPDYTMIYTLQRRIDEAAQKDPQIMVSDTPPKHAADFSGAGASAADRRGSDESQCAPAETVPRQDLIRVMLLQEMHRRRMRHRSLQDTL